MNQIINESDFEDHILNTYTISKDQFERLLEEFRNFYEIEIKEFIQLRHSELKNQGLVNDEIYSQISTELKIRRFAAPELSIRQIRRIIYG